MLGAYALLLLATIGSLLVSWKALKRNESLQRQIDWLRNALASRDSSIRSYESGTADDRRETTVIPPPPRIPRPPRP